MGLTHWFLYAEGGTRTRMPRGATPSRWCVCQFHHFGCFAIHSRALKPSMGAPFCRPLLFLRSCGRSRRALLLLLRLRSRSRRRLGRLTLLRRRLSGRLARLCGRWLRWRGRLLILLLRSFADDGRAAGPRDQNRQRKRREP